MRGMRHFPQQNTRVYYSPIFKNINSEVLKLLNSKNGEKSTTKWNQKNHHPPTTKRKPPPQLRPPFPNNPRRETASPLIPGAPWKTNRAPSPAAGSANTTQKPTTNSSSKRPPPLPAPSGTTRTTTPPTSRPSISKNASACKIYTACPHTRTSKPSLRMKVIMGTTRRRRRQSISSDAR